MKEKYDHRLLLKHLPSDFKQFMEHLQVLEYADKPDYGQFFLVSTCSYVIILFPAMISGIFERTMKRRGVRESDPFDWEKVSFLHQRHDDYHRDNNRQEMIITTIITLNPGWERQHSERRDRFRKPSGQNSAATK